MKTTSLFSAALALALCASAAFGADLAALQKEMKARMPQVIALLDKGVVGSNKQAYLEARGTLSAAEKKIVDAENAARRAVYAEIAKKNNTTIAVVEQQRAAQIAKRMPKGKKVWYQTADGKWRQS